MQHHSPTIFVVLLIGFLFTGVANGAGRFETRCGWFSNPTPANIWLEDSDGEWIIGVQGGHQVNGDWDWPAFGPSDWVKTNGNYGYGCACFEMRTDASTRQVLEIRNPRARPLSACKTDPTLRNWHQ